jgi:23S rRNA pseudouridine1911/1915/1917 synthase
MPERFVLGAEQRRERVDKVLARLLSPRSRATVQRWIAEGRVCVDGVPCRARHMVAAGAVLEVEIGRELTTQAEPDASVQFGVLFEDAHLIVVDKPAGVVVHPARGHRTGTLVSGLIARPDFMVAPADELDQAGHLRPGIVHRIDKDTSGVLVVAKDAITREGLKQQLAEHSMTRVYQALTRGVPREGRIETSYGRDPRSRLRFTSRLEQGKRAVTNIALLETFGARRAARVECRLETGRTHQIRVHLAEQAGTPLLADALYAGQARRAAGSPPAVDPAVEAAIAGVELGLGRHALHARLLGFEHPITRRELVFESPLPADFALALESLRRLGSTPALLGSR